MSAILYSNPYKRSFIHIKPPIVCWFGTVFDAYVYFYSNEAANETSFTDVNYNDISFKLKIISNGD